MSSIVKLGNANMQWRNIGMVTLAQPGGAVTEGGASNGMNIYLVKKSLQLNDSQHTK